MIYKIFLKLQYKLIVFLQNQPPNPVIVITSLYSCTVNDSVILLFVSTFSFAIVETSCLSTSGVDVDVDVDEEALLRTWTGWMYCPVFG